MRDKPRIKYISGRWVCYAELGFGSGRTPSMAWVDWAASRPIRNDHVSKMREVFSIPCPTPLPNVQARVAEPNPLYTGNK